MRVDVIRRISVVWDSYRSFKKAAESVLKHAKTKEDKLDLYPAICGDSPRNYTDMVDFFNRSKTTFNCKLLAWDIERLKS